MTGLFPILMLLIWPPLELPDETNAVPIAHVDCSGLPEALRHRKPECASQDAPSLTIDSCLEDYGTRVGLSPECTRMMACFDLLPSQACIHEFPQIVERNGDCLVVGGFQLVCLAQAGELTIGYAPGHYQAAPPLSANVGAPVQRNRRRPIRAITRALGFTRQQEDSVDAIQEIHAYRQDDGGRSPTVRMKRSHPAAHALYPRLLEGGLVDDLSHNELVDEAGATQTRAEISQGVDGRKVVPGPPDVAEADSERPLTAPPTLYFVENLVVADAQGHIAFKVKLPKHGNQCRVYIEDDFRKADARAADGKKRPEAKREAFEDQRVELTMSVLAPAMGLTPFPCATFVRDD